eukprot:110305-Pyramimonas_sp.AAC.1
MEGWLQFCDKGGILGESEVGRMMLHFYDRAGVLGLDAVGRLRWVTFVSPPGGLVLHMRHLWLHFYDRAGVLGLDAVGRLTVGYIFVTSGGAGGLHMRHFQAP